jgi:hypothetical protein
VLLVIGQHRLLASRQAQSPTQTQIHNKQTTPQPDDPLAGKTPEEVAAEAERRRKAEEARKAKAAKEAERAELRRQVCHVGPVGVGV